MSQSVEEWAGERAKMQSVVGMLAQEVKQLKHALEVKQLDYQTLQQEIHKRSSQIENESQSMVSNVFPVNQPETYPGSYLIETN